MWFFLSQERARQNQLLASFLAQGLHLGRASRNDCANPAARDPRIRCIVSRRR
jgi:hypothetical protein